MMPMNQPMAMQGSAMPMQSQVGYPTAGAGFGNALGAMVAGANFGGDDEKAEKPADGSIMAKIAPGFFMDLGARREEDATMHAFAFQGDSKTEEMFKILPADLVLVLLRGARRQRHGERHRPARVGLDGYSTGTVSSKAEVSIWLLIYGGVALDIGIMTMGHHIMAALGNRPTLQSPSGGFCIEIGGMLTVMIASKFGIHVSTTHCLTGATNGVGLCNGALNAVNWRLLGIIAFGWILTCPAASVLTDILFWGMATRPPPTPGNGFFEGQYHG
jgi:hypothetical protein